MTLLKASEEQIQLFTSKLLTKTFVSCQATSQSDQQLNAGRAHSVHPRTLDLRTWVLIMWFPSHIDNLGQAWSQMELRLQLASLDSGYKYLDSPDLTGFRVQMLHSELQEEQH